MDLGSEQLQFLSIPDILKESISIPKQSPKTFSLITLTLIFPLSFAILAHSLLTHSFISQLPTKPTLSSLTKLLIFQFFYLIFLFAFSLLSTAAVVFTVASLYTSKPVSFSYTVSAIPSIFKRLFITFLFVAITLAAYSLVVVLLTIAVDDTKNVKMLILFYVVLVLFLFVHIYISELWHLASVVSVLEPIYGYAAMKKSYELLKGKVEMGFVLVSEYFAVCTVINILFRLIVVYGGDDYGVITRIVVGGFLVCVLVAVNLIGLLVQSVFYYVCKSYHHQGIDKNALYEHLGVYLGEYVPLKSSIQMENLGVV